MQQPARFKRAERPRVLAIAAHPDDIEFLMAGTLLLLGEAGWDLHYFNVASGNCGSHDMSSDRTRRVRRAEARRAAALLGAEWHAEVTDDLEIFYNDALLRRVTAVVRDVAPRVVLTHSPVDYMEDHVNASRLAVTAAFARGMPNYGSLPRRPPVTGEVTVYHALPHGLRDGLRRRVLAGAFVDTTRVQDRKREALAAHHSQKAWLDVSQGMDSYLSAMDDMARAVGRMSGRYRFAEGWRRHSHLGFSDEASDPLGEALGARYTVNAAYEQGLDRAVRGNRC